MRTITFIFFFINAILYSQDVKEKWVSFAFLELNGDNKSNYTYYSSNKIHEIPLELKGNFELTYNVNYKMGRFSIGSGLSLINFIYPKFSSIKPSGDLKYFYVKDKYHFFTLGYGYHIPLNRDNFRERHQIKLGQIFDLISEKKYRLLLGFSYTYNFFYMEKPNHCFHLTILAH